MVADFFDFFDFLLKYIFLYTKGTLINFVTVLLFFALVFRLFKFITRLIS